VIGLDLAGDVVYAGTAIKDIYTYGVTALSTRTGELLWTVNFPENADYAGGVTVASGVVYATSSLGEVFAFDAANGNQLWRFADPAATIRTPPQVQHGIVYASSNYDKQSKASPVLYALHARTGRELWRHPLGAARNTGVAADGSGRVFATIIREFGSPRPDAGDLLAVKDSTGQPLWRVPVAGGVNTLAPVPGNVIYTGSGIGEFNAWQADTGKQLWNYRAAAAINGIEVDGGIAYFGSKDKRVYAVATGHDAAA
jgi:outer membrane protein assembly factor BamB